MSVSIEKKDLSVISSITLLVTTMIGTGIAFMPFAFRAIGYVESWIFLILVGIGTFFSLIVLAKIGLNKKYSDLTYTELAKGISEPIFVLVNIAIFCNSFFSNVTFYRFLSEILIDGFSMLRNLHGNREMARKYVVILLGPILLKLSLKKNLLNLRLSSWISTISTSLLMLLVMGYSILIGNKIHGTEIYEINHNYKDAIPFFISAMVCQPNMVPICRDLSTKSWRNIILISSFSSILGVLSYGLIGYHGYIIFGNGIEDQIMKYIADMESELNLYIRTHTIDRFNIFSRIAVYSIICTLIFGFPIQLAPVTEMFMSFFFSGKKESERIKTLVICFFFILCTLLVLIEKLEIKLIKRISGAIFSTSVGFVFPFIYFFVYNRERSLLSVISGIILTVTLITICYVIYSLLDDIRSSK